MLFLCNGFESRIRTIEDHGNFWFDNASLLVGDRLECNPEEFHMIIGDARDDRENGHYDVGRIESPSHAHLDHRIFTPDISKVEECEKNTFLVV